MQLHTVEEESLKRKSYVWLCCKSTLGTMACRSDKVVGEIALGGLEKEDKELHQLDFAVFSKVICPSYALKCTHAWTYVT